MENRFETILFNTIIIQDKALYYKLFNSAKNIIETIAFWEFHTSK
jgi:hypothetical protein